MSADKIVQMFDSIISPPNHALIVEGKALVPTTVISCSQGYFFLLVIKTLNNDLRCYCGPTCTVQ